MDKPINEHFIKVSSQIPFPKEVQLGDDITLTLNGHAYIANCVKIEQMDNQDGSINQRYILKLLTE
jgi:hypothetical protein